MHCFTIFWILKSPICRRWLIAVDRPELGHLTVQELHSEYSICDLHFTFLDEHRILMDDAIPNLNIPLNLNKSFHPPITNDLNKSTQTNFINISESTQTERRTKEIACQTESSDELQWKENPLKRKFVITVDDISEIEDPLDINPVEGIDQDANVTCQPDISSIVSDENSPSKSLKDELMEYKEKKKNSRKNSKMEQNKGKQKLKKAATPKKVKVESTDEGERVEMDQEEVDNMIGTRLEEAIKFIQHQWAKHEKKFSNDGTSSSEVIEQSIEKFKVKQGKAYATELKFLALNLYYSNPTAYKALRQHLNLPTEKTLRRIEIGISTKLTPTVLSWLKLLVNKLKEEEKYCVLCASMLPLKPEVHKMANTDKSIGYHEINEVQVKEPACKTLVVLLKGLYSDWKQPLLTCYLHENFNYNEVNQWLDDIIRTLLEIDFKVVAFTTNENPNLLDMARERHVSIETPYFFINNHKIYYVFDIINIMNTLRDLLIDHYFRYIDADGIEQIASWFDIEKLFETDKTRVYKLAPRLTETHIRPNDLNSNKIQIYKTKIQYSTQVFSKTVASGIVACIEMKHLNARSYGTVKFVELLNNTFDILNSIDENDPCPNRTPFCFKDFQIEIMENMLTILQNIKIITKNYEDITHTIETPKCLEITIRSVLGLTSDLKAFGNEYLCTRNLNLEHLDEFFESLRKKWGFKATPVLFHAGFRNFFLENIIRKTENSECGLDKDLVEILLKDNSYRVNGASSKDSTDNKNYNHMYK